MIGRPSVIRARRVLDRFAAADGGLLAAGIAYNATLALIPLAVLVAAIGGFVLTDADSQRRFIDVIVSSFDEIMPTSHQPIGLVPEGAVR